MPMQLKIDTRPLIKELKKRMKKAEQVIQKTASLLVKEKVVDLYKLIVLNTYSSSQENEFNILARGSPAGNIYLPRRKSAGGLSAFSTMMNIAIAGTIGTWRGGRILSSGFQTLHQILNTQKVITRPINNGVEVTWGNKTYINISYKFQYMTARRGIQTTHPFMLHSKGTGIIDAIEHGATWRVKPRSDNVRRMLSPEPRIAVREMDKQMPAIRPKYLSEMMGLPLVKEGLTSAIKAAMEGN